LSLLLADDSDWLICLRLNRDVERQRQQIGLAGDGPDQFRPRRRYAHVPNQNEKYKSDSMRSFQPRLNAISPARRRASEASQDQRSRMRERRRVMSTHQATFPLAEHLWIETLKQQSSSQISDAAELMSDTEYAELESQSMIPEGVFDVEVCDWRESR
jgi:hypothetical protein